MRTQSAQSAQSRTVSACSAISADSAFGVRCCVVLAAPAAAHDLERTQVLLTFARDGSFVLDVANDPSWLKLRLESFPGSFADRVVLWVDGHEVRPTSVEYLPPAETDAVARTRPPSPARPFPGGRAHTALVLRAGDRSLSADRPQSRRPRAGRGNQRRRLEPHDRCQRAVPADVGERDRRRLDRRGCCWSCDRLPRTRHRSTSSRQAPALS